MIMGSGCLPTITPSVPRLPLRRPRGQGSFSGSIGRRCGAGLITAFLYSLWLQQDEDGPLNTVHYFLLTRQRVSVACSQLMVEGLGLRARDALNQLDDQHSHK
ncbi:unnamed protein product [Lota lota]